MNHSKIFSEGNIGCIMRGIFSNIINTLGMCVFFEDIRCIYSHPYSGLDVKEIPTPMLTMTSFDALLREEGDMRQEIFLYGCPVEAASTTHVF
ncbi:uncharacterized protein LOC124685105 isoform X2 [Lolium rigidum]|uniref:uncharacterized protein LOC124685105 isoform X2 n=1 Tax=Lolium rigidum TaxID=89674 RepID=UPI001F5DAB63|nr:uncharacterized protein LOC124685105 isoform X2 [Lolium rigidum]